MEWLKKLGTLKPRRKENRNGDRNGGEGESIELQSERNVKRISFPKSLSCPRQWPSLSLVYCHQHQRVDPSRTWCMQSSFFNSISSSSRILNSGFNFDFDFQEPCLLSHIRIYNKSVLEWEIAVGLRYKVGQPFSFCLHFIFFFLVLLYFLLLECLLETRV